MVGISQGDSLRMELRDRRIQIQELCSEIKRSFHGNKDDTFYS